MSSSQEIWNQQIQKIFIKTWTSSIHVWDKNMLRFQRKEKTKQKTGSRRMRKCGQANENIFILLSTFFLSLVSHMSIKWNQMKWNKQFALEHWNRIKSLSFCILVLKTRQENEDIGVRKFLVFGGTTNLHLKTQVDLVDSQKCDFFTDRLLLWRVNNQLIKMGTV